MRVKGVGFVISLRSARVHQPVTLVLSLLLWIPGLLAVVFGEQVSQGLTNVGVGALAHAMGAVLMAGSGISCWGILRVSSLAEAVGLVMMAAAVAIYGIGVVFGLGLAGAFAGPVTLALAGGLILRAASLPLIAAENARREP